MHDLILAQDILKLVLEYAEKNNLTKVKKVELELGNIIDHDEAITKENLEFNFANVSKGTIAEGAELQISKREDSNWNLVAIE